MVCLHPHGMQAFIVEVGSTFTSTTSLFIREWGWSFLLGAGTVPVGWLMRYIPVKEDPNSFANYYNMDTTQVWAEDVRCASIDSPPTLRFTQSHACSLPLGGQRLQCAYTSIFINDIVGAVIRVVEISF